MSQYYLISINISYVYSKLVHDYFLILYWSRRGRDRMLVGSTTTMTAHFLGLAQAFQ
jgi:hypothetical protein